MIDVAEKAHVAGILIEPATRCGSDSLAGVQTRVNQSPGTPVKIAGAQFEHV
jgi:hypothetical protein